MKPEQVVRVSCIIPAYNEGARIGAVLRAVSDHPLVDEVLVIDDCSQDDTASVAESFAGVTLIRQAQNGGKTRALLRGFDAMDGTHALLLDADLIGLTPDDVSALITPVLRREAGVTISLRGNAPGLWRAIGLDYISGERVLARDLLPSPDDLARLPAFGFEVFLNEQIVARNIPIRVVPWPGVRSPAKEAKHGLWSGLKADIGMMRDIFRTVPVHRLIRQILAMRRLRS